MFYDNNQRQIRDIEELIAENVDLLIVSPNEGAPLTPVIEKAMDEAIPVNIGGQKNCINKYTAFVGADNFQIESKGWSLCIQIAEWKGKYCRNSGDLKDQHPIWNVITGL